MKNSKDELEYVSLDEQNSKSLEVLRNQTDLLLKLSPHLYHCAIRSEAELMAQIYKLQNTIRITRE